MNNYNEVFKKIYYHLYSNSNSSRAETIISDLSKLLLCKLADEKNYSNRIIDKYLSGEESLNSTLIRVLEECYPTLPAYREGFSLDEESLKMALKEIKKIDLLSAPSQVIGDAFQALIGPNIRGNKGQFFTPRNVVKSIVNIIKPKAHEIIMDPACGPGGFLSEAYHYISVNEGAENFKGEILGIDKDKDLSYLATALLNILVAGNSTIHNENSLEFYANKIRNNEKIDMVDVIMANPPFGAKIGIKSKEVLEQYDFGYNWVCDKKTNKWSKTDQVLASQDPQMLFLELAIKLLKPGGRMGIVLPEGMFGNSRQAYIWEYVRSNGRIVALIDCPRTTFQPSTDTKTNILIFEKTPSVNGIQEVNVAVAVNCGHDKRGKSISPSGKPYPDDFIVLAEAYAHNDEIWKNCQIEGDYLVPRYHYNKAKQQSLALNSQSISFKEMLDKGFLMMRKGNEVGSEAYGTGNIPFVRTSDIINLEISKDPTNSVSEEIYNQFKDIQDLNEGDILFVFDGRYRIGNTAIVTKHNQKCVVQSHIQILKLTEEAPFTPYEFFYLLNLPEVKEQIRNLVFIQSTLGTIGPRIKEIQLPLFDKNIDWELKIKDFKETIETRAELLEKLQNFNAELNL